MNLDELIAKCEAATEGSRELDIAIHRALGRRATNETMLTPKQIQSHFETFSPHYTTSLDDAVLVVSPGEWWVINAAKGNKVTATWPSATVGAGKRFGEGRGKPFPLVLVIAALRARQAAQS